MELLTVRLDIPEDANLILGQAHFIKNCGGPVRGRDGSSPKGVEGPDETKHRRNFVRKIGYKLGE